MLTHLAIEGYRSLRELILSLDKLNVVTGPNGSGKSSLYKALRLMSDIGQGTIVRSLALEGGFDSVLWAGLDGVQARYNDDEDAPFRPQGTVRKNPISLKLGCAGEGLGYAIDLGHPQISRSMFSKDAAIKVEALWHGARISPSGLVAERRGPALRVRDENHKWPEEWARIDAGDSFLAQHVDQAYCKDVDYFRKRLADWRFYDHFRVDRVDRDAPARKPQVGVRTPILSDDGSDLAAALQTILEFGDGVGLTRAIDDAFDQSKLEVRDTGGGFVVTLEQRGLMRALDVGELSDGTLRYLMLCAALLSPRPPELMILNEPEASLSPALIAPLGRLIAAASIDSQIIVVTHSTQLSTHLAAQGANMIELEKVRGQTRILGEDRRPAWKWPTR